MDRRTFLKIAGIGSISIAAGCTAEPEKTLYALVHAPDDMVTGKAVWYASTCRECPAGCGIHIKNREGRAIKIEGNPNHLINRGKICMRGQSALQGVYHPDRIKTPRLKISNQWHSISFTEAVSLLKEKAELLSRKGPDRIYLMSENVGESLLALFKKSLDAWNSGPPLIYEPFAYESIKEANRLTFGINGLASYRMDESDFLLSFGADFLETWLSPVEYARKFKAMHQVNSGRKNLFYHIGPYQSLTGANADFWLPCLPGSEAALALGLIHDLLPLAAERHLPSAVHALIRKSLGSITREQALTQSGIKPEPYGRLLDHLKHAKRPLILGTGNSGSSMGNDLPANIAANLLNIVLDPGLALFDFENRHTVERAASGIQVTDFFNTLDTDKEKLLLLNNVNPIYNQSSSRRPKDLFGRKSLYIVSFSNFMDESSELADLILPVALPLETWDEYSGKRGIISTLQPAMGSLTGAPHLGDVFLQTAPVEKSSGSQPSDYRSYLYAFFVKNGWISDVNGWMKQLGIGNTFGIPPGAGTQSVTFAGISQVQPYTSILRPSFPPPSDLTFIALPSLRFFDGRGANRPWLCEIPDPLTQVAWQNPLRMHPQTSKKLYLKQEDVVKIKSPWGTLEAPVYETYDVKPGVLLMEMGQGHTAFGRYAYRMGQNPFDLLPPEPNPTSGALDRYLTSFELEKTGQRLPLAHTDGSRIQHDRKIARTVLLTELNRPEPGNKNGLTLEDFPLVLPLPEGYDPKRDFYPPHEHQNYRWGMTVDLDSCIGCGACMAACYAENNLGIVGLQQVLNGREMSWIRVERYIDPNHPEKIIFLPMMCQHCDNAPCEPVCPVYAPHHSAEGLNNQIYNRCIGTRFCSQNCPYKARRFNWLDWNRPEPLPLQLNPDVTARSKGVMEKCSFCIQRIKSAHNAAKNEKRMIRDGEIRPACLQACPTNALTFGNMMDKDSRVRRNVSDTRAYQILGYLNTKPAVIYLKKVIAES